MIDDFSGMACVRQVVYSFRYKVCRTRMIGFDVRIEREKWYAPIRNNDTANWGNVRVNISTDSLCGAYIVRLNGIVYNLACRASQRTLIRYQLIRIWHYSHAAMFWRNLWKQDCNWLTVNDRNERDGDGGALPSSPRSFMLNNDEWLWPSRYLPRSYV